MVMLWVDSSDYKDGISIFLNRLEEGAEVEITHNLGAMAIGWIQVIPDVHHSPDGKPVACWIANEAHFLAEVLLWVALGINRLDGKILFF